MTEEQRPVEISGPEYEKYFVHSPTDILYVLHGLMHKYTMVTAVFDHGANSIVTAVLDANDDHVILDYGADEKLDRKMVASGKVIFVSTLDRIRIQFSSSRVERVEYHGAPAFRIPLPGSLLRLQRREYFRISAAVTRPIEIRIALDRKNWVETKVVDLGVGGVGIINAPPVIDTTPGVRYRAQVLLPDLTVETDIEVRYAIGVILRNGQATRRLGAQFVKLPGKQQVMLQRYIISVERERRARLLAGE